MFALITLGLTRRLDSNDSSFEENDLESIDEPINAKLDTLTLDEPISKKLFFLIKNDDDLYKSIILYKPLELEVLMSKIPWKVSRKAVCGFLDDQGICFKAEQRERTRRKR